LSVGARQKFGVSAAHIKLISLKNNIVDNQAVISAEYEMKQVSAKLYITYTINNQGAVQVNQKMITDKAAKRFQDVPLRYATGYAEVI